MREAWTNMEQTTCIMATHWIEGKIMSGDLPSNFITWCSTNQFDLDKLRIENVGLIHIVQTLFVSHISWISDGWVDFVQSRRIHPWTYYNDTRVASYWLGQRPAFHPLLSFPNKVALSSSNPSSDINTHLNFNMTEKLFSVIIFQIMSKSWRH